ncbi:MAG: US12 family protein [Lachnospiraceae bacterium]|nr:US12 family protein [Lachnospiraceae bacterium]
MADMNKEYRLERMNNYAGTMVTERTYNLTIGLTLLWGVLINVVMATFFVYQILSLNYLLVVVLYFAGTIGCSILVHKSSSPAVSFAGFTGMAISMGLLLTFYVTAFTGHSVAYAFIATALITVIMVLLSMLYPEFFRNLGRTLFVSLIGCILVELIGSLVLGLPMTIIDYAVALIFCGYIGLDWHRAQQFPKTMDNAVDSAADIYLDVVNLFVRILSITGKRRN